MDKILTAALASVAAAGGQVYPLVADETATGSYVAVSYTHLDVYKRQLCSWIRDLKKCWTMSGKP